jgi:dimethylamine monooxygenase subunit C
MLVQGIKSRPEYHGVAIDPDARRHFFVLEGEGALALFDQNPATAELAKTDILYVATATASGDHGSSLASMRPNDLWIAATVPVLLNRFDVVLNTATMGTRIYISGTEGFIGQAMQVALRHGMDFNSIRTEHRGSEARRVQCVHCKGITDSVTTNSYCCTHCGLLLLVRDHYSRRIGAFQGVCIDAEEPGSAPPPVELFP